MAIVTQHYKPEWQTEEGVLIIVARVYVGKKRTSAYIPMPRGVHPEGVPAEFYRYVQEIYEEDDSKKF